MDGQWEEVSEKKIRRKTSELLRSLSSVGKILPTAVPKVVDKNGSRWFERQNLRRGSSTTLPEIKTKVFDALASPAPSAFLPADEVEVAPPQTERLADVEEATVREEEWEDEGFPAFLEPLTPAVETLCELIDAAMMKMELAGLFSVFDW